MSLVNKPTGPMAVVSARSKKCLFCKEGQAIAHVLAKPRLRDISMLADAAKPFKRSSSFMTVNERRRDACVAVEAKRVVGLRRWRMKSQQ